MDAVVTATTTMAQGPEASTSTDTRRQGVAQRTAMVMGAGGGEDDHHGYAGIALIMVCE